MSRILIMMALIVSCLSSFAQAAEIPDRKPPQLTVNDLAPWLDGLMATEMETNKIAGAVVIVVKDGEIFFKKGYGFSDVAAKKSVDPDTTLFQMASITKLFTWTAVMQLVESGKINLDADINTYLDFKVIGKGDKPITMRHLMTHSAGFEDFYKYSVITDLKNLKPLAQFMKENIPARIFFPGEKTAYSNYGAGLAGYIVQRMSGVPYDDYVDQHIFKPLGMLHSTTHQPMTAALKSNMSKGYDTIDGDAKPFEFAIPGPDGSLASTGSDMAQFMIAHLQNESPGGLLLGAETAKLMHRTKTCAIPKLDCNLLGFLEKKINGHDGISHDGDFSSFHSDLSLFIEDKIGVFIAVNSNGLGNSNIRKSLLQSFGNRYFPETAKAGTVDTKTAQLHAKQVAGYYLWSRRANSNFGKVADIGFQTKLKPEADGTLSFALGSLHYRFKEVEPYLWREVNGSERLAVVMDGNAIKRMSIDYLSSGMVFEPVSFFQSAPFITTVMPLAYAVILMSLLAWPAAILVRRQYAITRIWRAGEKRAYFSRHTASLLLFASTIFWGMLIAKGLSSAGVTDADNGQILFTQIFSIVSAILILALSFIYVRWSLKQPMCKSGKLMLVLWPTATAYILLMFYYVNFFKIGVNY